MQAHKLKGKVDRTGKLIITEPTNLAPGEVKVIVLQSNKITENSNIERPSKVKAFTNWFAKAQPVISEFNADDARWNYMKEKHDL